MEKSLFEMYSVLEVVNPENVPADAGQTSFFEFLDEGEVLKDVVSGKAHVEAN